MLRILFVLYLPLMLAPVPVGAAEKKAERQPAERIEDAAQLADNYEAAELGYTLEIKVKSVAKPAQTKKK